MPRLTKRTVETAEVPVRGEAFLWDDDLRGFGLRVYASGRRIFVVQYRLRGGRGGRTRRIVLGEYGKMTPDEARKRAAKLLAAVDDGRDPAAERDEAKSALTVSDLAGIYLEEGPAAKPNKRASSWATDRSNIERHVKPLLGGKLAKALTQADVAKFQADVAAGKSKADVRTGFRGRAIIEGGRGTAARSLAVLGAMLQFAFERKLIPSNPAKGVRLLKGQPKERFLSEAEVARLGDTLAAMQAEHRLSANAADAIRLLLLTGCRKSEITALRLDWIDFERGCLRLPTSKTGAKVVALAGAALELLATLRERNLASGWVLPAAKGSGHYTGLQKDWETRPRQGRALRRAAA
jgi:integrase